MRLTVRLICELLAVSNVHNRQCNVFTSGKKKIYTVYNYLRTVRYISHRACLINRIQKKKRFRASWGGGGGNKLLGGWAQCGRVFHLLDTSHSLSHLPRFFLFLSISISESFVRFFEEPDLRPLDRARYRPIATSQCIFRFILVKEEQRHI